MPIKDMVYDRKIGRKIFFLISLQVILYFACVLARIDARPLLNLDFFIVSAIINKFRKIGLLLFVVAVLVALFDIVASAYHFDIVPFAMSFDNLSFDILESNWLIILTLFIISFIILGFGYNYLALPPRVSFSLVILVIFIDATLGTSDTIRLSDNKFNLNGLDFAYSGFNRVYVQIKNITIPKATQEISIADSAFSKLNIKEDRSVILLIVESLGARSNKFGEDHYGYNNSFAKLSYLKVVSNGVVSTHGSTVSGELRELCGIAADGYYKNIDYKKCLVWKFREKNYLTIGAHSYRSSMFDRKKWWSHIGFENSIFKEDVLNEYPLCRGALSALCDQNMLEGEIKKINPYRPFLLYYLTANTHLPLPMGVDANKLFNENLQDLLGAIERALIYKNIYEVDVVVVGDHPPPFIGENRDNYQTNRVPYWILSP